MDLDEHMLLFKLSWVVRYVSLKMGQIAYDSGTEEY
jgi:hypothetical protein